MLLLRSRSSIRAGEGMDDILGYLLKFGPPSIFYQKLLAPPSNVVGNIVSPLPTSLCMMKVSLECNDLNCIKDYIVTDEKEHKEKKLNQAGDNQTVALSNARNYSL